MDTLGIFWGSTFVIGYIYVGYPVLLAAWARACDRPVCKAPLDGSAPWPSMSIVVAARNEAPRLPERIANLLSLPYPGPLDIVVVSDGSTDGTLETLRQFLQGSGAGADRVRVLEIPAGGKPLALNAGVAASSGEILVFADARQRFSQTALLELAANFNDEQVGAVTGELVLDCEQSAVPNSTVSDGVGLYWTYEKWLRRNESAVWSTLGATGAIYALRRRLWSPLPAETLLDDVLAPMRAVLQGYRIVFEEQAIAYDRTSLDAGAESRRKTRTLAGNYQILAQEPRLLLPVLNRVWLQYFSHKVGRLLVPWAMLGALISSVALAPSHWFYAAALTVQVGFYGLAGLGALIEWRRSRKPGEFEGITVPLSKGAR